MTYIKSRKHAARSSQPALSGIAAATLVALSLPAGAQTPPASGGTLRQIDVQAAPDTYRAEKPASEKYSQPLVDTPQTITVIRKEVLQEQGGTSLKDALRNTPGITLQLGENGNTQSGDSISMRGFDTQGSIFLDGVRDLGSYSRDTFNVEQVEVMKGPTGSDIGRASAGGYINLVSKTPQVGDFFGASASYGSASKYRLTADLNRDLAANGFGGGNSAVRLNLMTEDGGVPGRDHVENRSIGFAPSIAFGLNSPTRTTLSYLYLQQKGRPDGGVPTVGLPGYNVVSSATVTAAQAAAGRAAPAVDRSNFYGSLADFDNVDAQMLTAKIEHDFSSTLKLRNTFRVGTVDQRRMTTSIISPTFTIPGDLSSYVVSRNRSDGLNRNSDGGQGKDQTNDILVNQTHLSAAFNTGSIEHTLGTGVELMREKQNRRHLANASGGTGAGGATIPAANLYNPDPAFPLVGYAPTLSGSYDKGETKSIGLYVFDTLKFNEQWQVSAGLRWDKYDTDFDSFRAAGTAPNAAGLTSLSGDGTLLSWKLGAVYKPTPSSSLYALYSVSKRPPGGDAFSLSGAANNANNPASETQEARNVELGAKWDVNRNLSLTGAIFDTENKNEYVTDAASGLTTPVGKRRVRGLELGAVGQITPAWQVIAGAQFLDAKIVRGNNAATSATTTTGGELPFTPERAFTAWTTYKLPMGLTIGGGARYVSKQTRTSNVAPAAATGIYEAPAYWVFDGLLAYQVNKNVSLQLNVYNLADKDYAASFNNGGGRYTPGTPRSATLTANFLF